LLLGYKVIELPLFEPASADHFFSAPQLFRRRDYALKVRNPVAHGQAVLKAVPLERKEPDDAISLPEQVDEYVIAGCGDARRGYACGKFGTKERTCKRGVPVL